MASDESGVEIVVCLGSSCFARGNAQNLTAIESYLDSHGLQKNVRVTGCLCQDECKRGPNVTVRGEAVHEVSAAKLRELLSQLSVEAH
jgi:NADH:ubiquinone oxidoreductase subunit E